MKYLVFRIGSFRLALDINNVLEIIIPGLNGNNPPEKLLSEKLMIYNEKQVQILCLADILFNLPVDNSINFRIIIIELNGDRFGLMVDNADEIVLIAPEDINKTKDYPREIQANILEGKYIEEKKEIYILAPDKILSAVKTI